MNVNDLLLLVKEIVENATKLKDKHTNQKNASVNYACIFSQSKDEYDDFIEVTNKDAVSDGVKSLMKPFIVPRRFIIEQDSTGTYMVFGHGSDDEADIQINVADPSSVALKMTGKNYITDTAFDPTKLLDTNKLGVAPQNTTLTKAQ